MICPEGLKVNLLTREVSVFRSASFPEATLVGRG